MKITKIAYPVDLCVFSSLFWKEVSVFTQEILVYTQEILGALRRMRV